MSENQQPIRVLALRGLKVRRYNDLQHNLHDVKWCDALFHRKKSKIRTSYDSANFAIWIAILTKFFSCFGESKSRGTLDFKTVFKKFDAGKNAFLRLRDIRNKSIVHDENSSTQSNAVLEIINGAATLRHMIAGGAGPSSLDVEQFALILPLTITYLETAIAKLKPVIQAQVDAMSEEEINALEEWRVDLTAAMFKPEMPRVRID